ncbi:hypothetical protein PGN35_025750 [Nodosilinea sp. PGN35]|uniref:hypothetical protein n=1 Tax=Nodosilinea sp. PGN35 TaxID=3020489 RepID=UPI0023B260AE|nr:hypothetical protein [Nodosilinea sp. TSF1-S3]MDF0367358.1 hypothetical protein [Nodosilinea sp. TSF1-S3]
MLHRDRPLAHRAALVGSTALLLALGGGLQAQEPAPGGYLRPTNPCPNDPQVLATQLLADLPSYANRVSSRNLDLSTAAPRPGTTVLVASAPDLTPLDLSQLSPGGSAAGFGLEPGAELQQVFFTTLERQYWQGQSVSLQHHHWLFLAPTQEGWYMALLFSSLSSYRDGGPLPAGRPPTPPQESSDGIVGQAIRLWLRDCRAGAVFPVDAGAEGTAPGPSTNP